MTYTQAQISILRDALQLINSVTVDSEITNIVRVTKDLINEPERAIVFAKVCEDLTV